MAPFGAKNTRGNARFELVRPSGGKVNGIEPNVHPNIGKTAERAKWAKKIGNGYPALIRMIVNQALRQKTPPNGKKQS